MSFRCGQCGFYSSTNQACLVLGTVVNPTDEECNKFQSNPTRCEICGLPLITKFIDEGHVLCGNCVKAVRTCAGCDHGKNCDFETNPSELPKVITQTNKQGNMVMQMQVKNPERIEITCKNGCPCYDPENDCLRQFNICANVAHEWPVNKTTSTA